MTVSINYLLEVLQYLKYRKGATQVKLDMPFDYVVETDRGNWYARVLAKEAEFETWAKATD